MLYSSSNFNKTNHSYPHQLADLLGKRATFLTTCGRRHLTPPLLLEAIQLLKSGGGSREHGMLLGMCYSSLAEAWTSIGVHSQAEVAILDGLAAMKAAGTKGGPALMHLSDLYLEMGRWTRRWRRGGQRSGSWGGCAVPISICS